MAYAGSLKRHDIPKDFVFPGWGDSIWRYCDEDTPATNPVMKKGWKVDINDTKENQVPEPPPDPDPDPDPTKVVEVRITLEDGSIQEFVPK